MTTLDPQDLDVLSDVRSVRAELKRLSRLRMPPEIRVGIVRATMGCTDWLSRAEEANERQRVSNEQDSVLDHQREPGRNGVGQ